MGIPAAVRAPPEPARLSLGTSHAGSSLRDPRSLQGNLSVAPTRGSTSCLGPWGGAGLQAPGRDLETKGPWPGAPVTLTSAPRCLVCSLLLPRCGSHPTRPQLFTNSREQKQKWLALCLVGAGWDLSVGRPCPLRAGSLRSVTRVAWSSGGQLWAQGGLPVGPAVMP